MQRNLPLQLMKAAVLAESSVIHLSSASLFSCDVYGQQPGRCRTLSSLLIHFLSLQMVMAYDAMNLSFDKKYIKMKRREQHLPNSRLQTSLEQTDHDESVCIRSLQPTLWLSSAEEVDPFHCDLSAPVMSKDMSQVDVTLFPSF